MRCTMLGALVLLSAAKVTLAQGGAQVEPVQLTVRHKPTIEGVKVFGDPGVELQVAVRLPGKPILAVDSAKSRIVSFVDDVGTDLGAGAPTGFFSWVSLSSAFRDEPVASALLDIKTRTLPAAKAQRLEIHAVVALITASGTQDKSAKVALKKGAKIEFGPIPMTISNVEKSSFGGSAINVQISSDQRMDAIKEIVFLDGKGKPIDAKSMGSGSFGMGGKKTYTKSYGLPKRVAEVSLRIVSYTKMETVEVPIKLSMGLGLR